MGKLFLEEIIQYKKSEIKDRKKSKTLEELISFNDQRSDKKSIRFRDAISRPKNENLKLIAEIKKASPSRGVLRKDFYPDQIAKIYETYGASAISVLTDGKFFQGSLENLETVSETVSLPVLRKDFILDEYQVYEAKAHGAKAALLIVSILKKSELIFLLDCIEKLNLCSLVEVHDEKELEIALECGVKIIGINNRDLKTFQVDLTTCEKLVQKIPAGHTVVVESGILTRDDVLRVSRLPVDAILVGEAFMTANDIAYKMKELMGNG
jgi:indole-3-glycerol phosphate synthase